MSLARTHHKHEWYFKILLEDKKSYQEALEYIRSLEFKEAEKNMKQYGKAMVNNLPELTTEFLLELCTFYVPKQSEFGVSSTSRFQFNLINLMTSLFNNTFNFFSQNLNKNLLCLQIFWLI